MRHRRFRRNAWFGQPIGHHNAAIKGYRSYLSKNRGGHRRRTRKNRGGGLSGIYGKSRSIVTKGVKVLPQAGAILLGNVGATWGVEQLGKFLPIVKNNRYAEVISLFGLGALNGIISAKLPIKALHKYSNSFYIGGMLAGVTRSLKYIFPGTFQTCGIGDYEPGMGDWFVSAGPHGNVAQAWPSTAGWHAPHKGPYPHPHLPYHAQHMHGMGAYVGVNTPIDGLGDYAQFGSTAPSAMVHSAMHHPMQHHPAMVHPMQHHQMHMRGMGDAMGEVLSEISSMA